MIDPSPWTGLELVEPLAGGHRSEVWLGRLRRPDPRPVVVRRSRRSDPSLAWELDLMADLRCAGFRVPALVSADDGRRAVDGVVVQGWLDGRPPATERDRRRVAEELQRLHGVTRTYRQRPDCCPVCELVAARRSVDADLDAVPSEVVELVTGVFADFVDVPRAVVHGDPGPGNVRIDDDGAVGLIDWDESRVDIVWHDLSNLDVTVLDADAHRRAQRLSNAWEAVNAWTTEPDYARARLRSLLDDLD